MSVKQTLDKAIKTVDGKGLGKKFFEFTVDITYRKTGKSEKNAKVHASGGNMQNALAAMRTKYKMYGYDIVVKDVKEVNESASKVWIESLS